MNDKKLIQFLKPFFENNEDKAQSFIEKCLAKKKTLRMLNRLHWLTEVADGLEKVKKGRPALKLVFLITIIESIAILRLGKKKTKNLSSLTIIKDFFQFISEKDKTTIRLKFKRTLLSIKHHTLRFSSIIKIFYNVRNSVVHEGDFYSFSFQNEKSKQEDAEQMTYGKLGTRKRKRRVCLDLKLTYEEFRDIVIRTAIANIKSLF